MAERYWLAAVVAGATASANERRASAAAPANGSFDNPSATQPMKVAKAERSAEKTSRKTYLMVSNATCAPYLMFSHAVSATSTAEIITSFHSVKFSYAHFP